MEFKDAIFFHDLRYTSKDCYWLRSVSFKLSIDGFMFSKIESINLFDLASLIVSLFFASGLLRMCVIWFFHIIMLVEYLLEMFSRDCVMF